MIDTHSLEEARKRLADINAELEHRERLSIEKWQEICYYIKIFELPCRLLATGYGFYLEILDHSNIQWVKPDRLIAIESDMFPFPSAQEGYAGQMVSLRQLELLTHSPRNAELLRWHGFETLMPIDHY